MLAAHAHGTPQVVGRHELLHMSAARMAALIREGAVSSRTAVEAHISEVERVNPRIRAMVVDRFAAARREADRADELVRARAPETAAPFFGVPCSVKESFALAGMPQTGGLKARADHYPTEDATAVARLRAAGAIPLGVTNVSELCMWYESHNTVYGRTSNPYDPGRIAGGSSGGEGALVGAGATPMGLGADIGGSIRIPAFFCGVFGHKSTGGVVPATGSFPVPENEALRYMVSGPLCRRAEDLMPFLRAVAGPDGIDPGCQPVALGDERDVPIEGLRVVSIETNGTTRVHPELTAAQRRVADHLARRGARVETVRLAALRHSFAIWSSMLAAAAETSFHEMLGHGRELPLGRELGRYVLGRSAHTLPALALAVLEKLPTYHGARGQAYVAMGRTLQSELEALIGARGVLLYPPFATLAPRHRVPLVQPFAFVYTAILNVLEMPSTAVPLGLGKKGLPLGVQVAARRGADHLTIGVALELERAFGGWVKPTL
ncbi:MAG: amidase [Myxococcales bacterium]|nr:amidase [Myxococcales bacterium]